MYFVFIILDFLMCLRTLFCDLLSSGQCFVFLLPVPHTLGLVHVLSSGVACHNSCCWRSVSVLLFPSFSSWWELSSLIVSHSHKPWLVILQAPQHPFPCFSAQKPAVYGVDSWPHFKFHIFSVAWKWSSLTSPMCFIFCMLLWFVYVCCVVLLELLNLP